MTTTTHRTVADRAAAISRMTFALARNPGEWDISDLRHIDHMEADLADLRGKVVRGLRESGHTDAEIGAQLGITRQAVSKRWPGGGRYVGAAGRYRKTSCPACGAPPDAAPHDICHSVRCAKVTGNAA